MTKFDFVIKNLYQVASQIFQDNSGEVFLFGSQARKEANANSDWDLLVLTKDKLGKEDGFNKYGFPFCEIGWKLNEDINPLVYSYEDWEAQKHSYFFYNVMRDAIKIFS